MATTRCDVLVIGGGITGCSTAWHLAGYGAEVVLLDRFDLNTQASGRNAGSLHGQIQQASFLEFGEEWARAFLPALRFLSRSLEMWRNLSDVLDTDLEVSLNGGLLVAETSEQMRDIERKVAIERSGGVESDMLGPADLQRIAPYVSESMAGAQLCRVEGKVNSMLAAPAFARAAVFRGVVIRTNTEVIGLDHENAMFTATTTSGTVAAERVVLATGNDLNRFASLWGRELPIFDDPAQVGATEPVAPMVHNLVYFAGGKLTFKQAKAGTLLIGGGWSSDIDPDHRAQPGQSPQPRRQHESGAARRPVPGGCAPDPHLARQGSRHTRPGPDHRRAGLAGVGGGRVPPHGPYRRTADGQGSRPTGTRPSARSWIFSPSLRTVFDTPAISRTWLPVGNFILAFRVLPCLNDETMR